MGNTTEENLEQIAPPSAAPARPKSKMVLAIVIVAVLVVAAIAGAWAAGLIGGKKKEAKELVIAMSSDIQAMDPGKTSAMYGPAGMIYETLITRDLEGNYHPGLAESYAMDRTALTFTMHLKSGVKFHDGTDFNSEAVKQLVRWYKMGFVAYEFMAINTSSFSMVGGELVENVTGNLNQGIWCQGPLDVVFNLTFPDVALVFNLSHLYGSVMSPTALWSSGATEQECLDNYGIAGGHKPIGTGPFMLEDWVAGDHVTLVKNKNHTWSFDWYTNKGPAHIDKVTYRVIADEAARFSGFESGAIDILMQVPPSKIQQYAGDSKITLIEKAGQGTYHIEFNCQKDPWTNASLRRAFGFAIDRATILSAVWHGYGEQGVNYLSPICPEGKFIPAQYNYSYDPTKASVLLAEAGWTIHGTDKWVKNSTGHELTLPLWTTTKGEDVQMSTILKDQIEAIGVHVTLRQMAENQIRAECAAGTQDSILFWYSWPRAEILDWHFGGWAQGNPNTGWYNDSVFDDYVTNWTYAPTDAAFSENATSAHERLLMQGGWAPILFWHQIVAVHDYVKDFGVSVLGQEQVINAVDMDIVR